MADYVMALDAGTTGIRAIVFDHDARVVSQAYQELHPVYPREGWCELDPEDVWRQCLSVMQIALRQKDIPPRNLAALGIATLRSTNLLWDRQTGRPLYNAITWHDTRTASLCRQMDGHRSMRLVRGLGRMAQGIARLWPDLRHTPTGARLITAAHMSFTPASALAHTRWMLDHVEDARQRAEAGEVLTGTMDTWLVWKLTGGEVHATDFSNASATNMFDSFSLKWSDLFLELFDIPAAMLPEVRDTTADFGEVDASLLGSPLPIRSVVADQQAALFGETCFSPGDVKCTNGTGTFIDMNVGPRPPASLHKLLPLIAWSIDGQVTYMLEGMINTTGSAIQWLRDNLQIIESVEDSDRLAQTVPDTEDVYFVPGFTGLSSPYWDPHACGVAVGLGRNTRKEHIVRAVLEGIVYRCKDILLAMEIDAGIPIKSITVDGGACRNDFLVQFTADMLNVTVQRPAMVDGTAKGAAYLAGLAAGYWSSLDELREKQHIDQVFEPSIGEERRRRLYAGWKRAITKSFKWRDYSA
ncbi:MAG: FGGY family carbohydrate kinase, partial [Thermoplasmatota archaeon]